MVKAQRAVNTDVPSNNNKGKPRKKGHGKTGENPKKKSRKVKTKEGMVNTLKTQQQLPSKIRSPLRERNADMERIAVIPAKVSDITWMIELLPADSPCQFVNSYILYLYLYLPSRLSFTTHLAHPLTPAETSSSSRT